MADFGAIEAIGAKKTNHAQEIFKQKEALAGNTENKTAFMSMPPIFGNPAANDGACGVQA